MYKFVTIWSLDIQPKYQFYVLFSTELKSLNLRKTVVIMQMFRLNSIFNNTYVIQSLFYEILLTKSIRLNFSAFYHSDIP